jgi:hypothetical protein
VEADLGPGAVDTGSERAREDLTAKAHPQVREVSQHGVADPGARGRERGIAGRDAAAKTTMPSNQHASGNRWPRVVQPTS